MRPPEAAPSDMPPTGELPIRTEEKPIQVGTKNGFVEMSSRDSVTGETIIEWLRWLSRHFS